MKKITALVLALLIAASTASCSLLPKKEPAPESSAITEESSETSGEEPIRDLMTPERVEGKPLSQEYVDTLLSGGKVYIDFKTEFADNEGNVMPVNAKIGFTKDENMGISFNLQEFNMHIIMDIKTNSMYLLNVQDKKYFNLTEFLGEDAEISTPADTIEKAEPTYVQTIEREAGGKMCEVDEYTGSEGSGKISFCFVNGRLYGIELANSDKEPTFIEVFALSDEVPAEMVTLPADYKEGNPLDLIKLMQTLGDFKIPKLG